MTCALRTSRRTARSCSPPAVVATNHQGRVEWHEHARATKSVERERALERLVGQSATPERFVDGFLQPPLFAVDGDRRMGTLYTVAYHVGEARAEFRWPEGRWEQRFGAFTEGVRVVELAESSAA